MSISLSSLSQVKYVTDENGDSVIVPLQASQNILEELETLQEKKEVLSGLQQACFEAKMQENNKMQEQTLDEFLHEL